MNTPWTSSGQENSLKTPHLSIDFEQCLCLPCWINGCKPPIVTGWGYVDQVVKTMPRWWFQIFFNIFTQRWDMDEPFPPSEWKWHGFSPCFSLHLFPPLKIGQYPHLGAFIHLCGVAKCHGCKDAKGLKSSGFGVIYSQMLALESFQKDICYFVEENGGWCKMTPFDRTESYLDVPTSW